MTILYDQFGREAKLKKKPDHRPLGAASRWRSSREYITEGLTPLTLATIFREADGGDMRRQAELFNTICEKDGHLLGEITKRRQAIVDVEFRVTPASENARDVKVAEFVQALFENATEDDEDIVALQEAVGSGYSAMEIDWDISEGQAVPKMLTWIDANRLIFTDPTGALCKYPRLITDNNLMGEDIPPWKMIFHAYGGKTGHPTRSGILRVCTWMYLFKNFAIKDWVTFCEIYGMPIRLGKYEPGAATDDREALITALASIGTDAAGVISKSTEIEFIQAQGGASSADLYNVLCNFANKEMSKAIVGQTLSADVGDVGSYAAAKTHNEIRIDLAKADSRAIAVTRRAQLIRPIIGFNFGWDTPVPYYGPVWEEEEDLAVKAEWVDKILNRTQVPRRWVMQEFGIPEPEEGEEMIGGQQVMPTPMFSKKIVAKRGGVANQDAAIGALVTMFEREMPDLPGPVITAVRDLLARADSLQTFLAGLDNLRKTVDLTPATVALQKALACAELVGRAEINDEAGL